MSTRLTARRAAAALALRWHAGTGTLVALAAALTIAGAVPALTMLGGSAASPALTLALGDTPLLRADWGAGAVVWPQLQQFAVLQLLSLVRGATVLLLAVGAATLLALHLARTATRSGDVIVARSVGASRADVFGALLLEAGALAGVALFSGALLALGTVVVLRAAWPGQAGAADLALGAAGTLAITALVMVAPLLLIRALATTRLVDDDRRPLTLIVPALQLGAALVVLAGGTTLRGILQRQRAGMTDAQRAAVTVTDVQSTERDRLRRAQGFAALLAERHVAAPGALVGIAASGAHRRLGTSGLAMSDCGRCYVSGMPSRYRTETVLHAVVSADSFALTGTTLAAGRLLTDRDRWDAPLVAVVNRTLAREMFDGGDPVGRRIQLQLLGDRWFEVVGVVDDAVSGSLGGVMQPRLGVYVSVLQHPPELVEIATRGAAMPPDAVQRLGHVRRAAHALADDDRTDARALAWFTTLLLGMGGVTAVIAVGGLLVMLGLWLESQRRELGVRRAVGARRGDVHRLVLGRAAQVAGGGTLFGAWLGQIAWDVLPRVVQGAPMFDGRSVLGTGAALATLTLGMALLLALRFTRTPVGTLLLASE